MKQRRHKKFIVILVALTLFLFSITTYAAYFNTYTTVSTIPNGNSCNRAQGFAVGSSYVYSAKINDDDSKQVIYRTNMSTGTSTLMTNGANGTTFETNLGHANDMDTCTIGSTYNLFVATMKSGADSLVKVTYSGNTYTQTGSYTIKYNGVNLPICGVKKYHKDENNIYFLFFGANKDLPTTIYRGQISLTANSGTINVTKAFDLDIAGSLVDGKTVSGLENFTRQGIGYIASKDQLLIPLTNKNVSIILVFHNASTATGTVTSNPDLSFRITSGTYPTLFEIEGCDETNGRLYFNCNRKKTSSDISNDAVCYFNDFVP